MSPSRRARQAEVTSRSARVSQAISAVVLAALSAALMITTHRVQVDLGGLALPAGLLIGAVFQTLVCLFLMASTGARFPILALSALWGLFAMPFLTRGVGGGVLIPAQIGGVAQYQGWVVQLLGVGIPLLFALGMTISSLRSIQAEGRSGDAAAGEGPASR